MGERIVVEVDGKIGHLKDGKWEGEDHGVAERLHETDRYVRDRFKDPGKVDDRFAAEAVVEELGGRVVRVDED